MSKPKSLSNLLSQVAKLVFAAALIFWLIRSGKLDFAALKEVLQPQWIAIGLILVGCNWYFASERWRRILQTQNFRLSTFETMRLTMIGGFFNFVIPGGVGGDVVKGYYVAQNHPENKMSAVITIAIDRLLGLFSMVLMALLVMIYDLQLVLSKPELKVIGASLLLIFSFFMLFWVSIFSRRISSLGIIEKILQALPFSATTIKLYSSFTAYKDAKKAFFNAIFWSFLSQTVAIFIFIFVGWILNFNEIHLHTYFFVVPLGFMIMAVPISPAGIGVGQTAFYFLFNLVLPTPSMIGSMAITAMQIFNFLFGLIGAYFYITIKAKNKNKSTQALNI